MSSEIDGRHVGRSPQPFGPSNEPGTCLWCGRKLKKRRANLTPRWAARRGGYLDNAFCGLRCGYAFGLSLARLNKRLQPLPDKETADA